MFTANTTARLKLMKPLDSDQFQTSDYSDTFQILDDNPGVAMVDSYAGLATLATTKSYGTAQNGLLALDRSRNTLWRWNCPSGVGTWVRINSLGLLKRVWQSLNVSTSTTNAPGILVVTTGSFTVAGGRPVVLEINADCDNSSGTNGIVVFALYDGSTLLQEYRFRAGLPIGNSGSHHTASFHTVVPLNPESTHEYRLYMRSAVGSSSNGNGGTSVARYTTLTITEE